MNVVVELQRDINAGRSSWCNIIRMSDSGDVLDVADEGY